MSRQCHIVRRPQFSFTFTRALLALCLLPLAGTLVVDSHPAAAAERRQLQLTLREATALALQQNLDIQIAGLSPRIQEAQVSEEKSIYDVNVNSGIRYQDSQWLDDGASFRAQPAVGTRRDANGNLLSALAGQDDTQESEWMVGISQQLPLGGTYAVGLSNLHLDTNERLLGKLDDDTRRVDIYTAEIELKITQPLLKNFGTAVTENKIRIAQNNFSISGEAFRRQVINSTAAAQQTYWDLVFSRENLEVQRQQLALAEKLLSQVRRQVEVGTLAPIEVLQTETDIASINQRIIIAANIVRDAEDRLKRAMNLSLTGEFADVEIFPTDEPAYSPPALNQETEIGTALTQRHDLSQAKLALENQNIRLVFSKNQLLPTLDLAGSVRFNGINDNFGNSFSELEPGRHQWDVALVLKYPLSNRQAKSRLQQNRLAIRQQLLRIKNLEETIMADVRAAVRSVFATSQLVQASKAASRLASKQLDAEEKKLRVGLATVFTVLQFQEDLAVQRSAEIRSKTEYLKALVRLEAAKNTLLQTYNIVIEGAGPTLQ